MCTVHYIIFTVVKLGLFIRALLLDRILALEKTTRASRVHLVYIDMHFLINILYVLLLTSSLQYCYVYINLCEQRNYKKESNKSI